MLFFIFETSIASLYIKIKKIHLPTQNVFLLVIMSFTLVMVFLKKCVLNDGVTKYI